jgi:hypothetical protein
MYRSIILLSVLIASAPSLASAKCGALNYKIEGHVTAEEALHSHVRIYPFLEGTESTGIEQPSSGPQSADYVTPSPNGFFAIDMWLSTDSGAFSTGKDKCNRKAKYVDLFIVGDGIRARLLRLPFLWSPGSPAKSDAGTIKLVLMKE